MHESKPLGSKVRDHVFSLTVLEVASRGRLDSFVEGCQYVSLRNLKALPYRLKTPRILIVSQEARFFISLSFEFRFCSRFCK